MIIECENAVTRANKTERPDKLNFLLELLYTRWEDDAIIAEEFARGDNLEEFMTESIMGEDLDNDFARAVLMVALRNCVNWEDLTEFFVSRHEK